MIHVYYDKNAFLRKWIMWNALIICLSYPVGLIIGVLLVETMGYTMADWGTPLEQSALLAGFAVLLGLTLGFTQRNLLKKLVLVSYFWSFSLALGFVLIEVLVGLYAYEYGFNRAELTFYEGNSIKHAIILGMGGLLIGLFQFFELRQYFHRAGLWIISCTAAWGFSVLITVLFHYLDWMLLITFILGTILYGTITGITLVWGLQKKKLTLK